MAGNCSPLCLMQTNGTSKILWLCSFFAAIRENYPCTYSLQRAGIVATILSSPVQWQWKIILVHILPENCNNPFFTNGNGTEALRFLMPLFYICWLTSWLIKSKNFGHSALAAAGGHLSVSSLYNKWAKLLSKSLLGLLFSHSAYCVHFFVFQKLAALL